MSRRVRAATDADIAAIFAMRRAREIWLAARGLRQWPIGMVTLDQVTAQVEDGQWWLLGTAGDLAAAMRVIWSDEEFWSDAPGTAVYVHGLMVGIEHGGKRLGRTMLDAAQRMGREAGAEYFRLDCAADNERLKAIYRAYGFTEVGRRDFPGFGAVLMELPLNDECPGRTAGAPVRSVRVGAEGRLRPSPPPGPAGPCAGSSRTPTSGSGR